MKNKQQIYEFFGHTVEGLCESNKIKNTTNS